MSSFYKMGIPKAVVIDNFILFKLFIYTTQLSNCALEMCYYFLMAFSSFFTTQVTTVSTLQTFIHAFSKTLSVMDEVMV